MLITAHNALEFVYSRHLSCLFNCFLSIQKTKIMSYTYEILLAHRSDVQSGHILSWLKVHMDIKDQTLGKNPVLQLNQWQKGGHLEAVLEKTNLRHDGLTSRDRTTLISCNQLDPIKLPLSPSSTAIQSKRILINVFSN